MAVKLTDRDKRTLLLGAVCSVFILGLVYVPELIGHWREVRSEIFTMERTLQQIQNPKDAKQLFLDTQVPVYKMPTTADAQAFLFRDKLAEQIKKAGLKEVPLQTEFSTKKQVGGYQPLYLSYAGKCSFDKLLKLLVDLKTNPYYVGIEALRIDADPKKPAEGRKEMTIELTLTTLAKKTLS
ncbi:MAG: hypothetical protein HQ515_04415 [Phycisphaeraceae bacterium]|nr:hypothetical protein [Phycisphaeraceae bacterium]